LTRDKRLNYGWTRDGGKTWQSRRLETDIYSSDPSIVADSQGNFYIETIQDPYFPTRVVVPGKKIGIYESTDGGESFFHTTDVAIDQVGDNNALRFEITSNGVPNIPEFGSVKTDEGFKALLAMDAYHKVKDGVKYPAVLLTTGINDPRVEPWMSAKMAARLQAATTSNKPVLLRIDYDAGHGFGSTKRQRNEQAADIYAFLFQQLGAK